MLNSKKALLDNVGDWFFPALIALVLGFGAAYAMYIGMIPDPIGLFS